MDCSLFNKSRLAGLKMAHMKFSSNMTKYRNRLKAPNVVRGGAAIPLGNNLYYMAGRKHEKGGIDIGDDLEVEGDEVMQMRNNDVRVFSAQPILNGYSPAELVIRGYNPNDVFNAQERFKNINRIKDDGSRYKCGGKNNMNKRKRNGGIVSINGNVKDGLVYWASPSTGERKKAPFGTNENDDNIISNTFIPSAIYTPTITEYNISSPGLNTVKVPNRLAYVNVPYEDVNKVSPYLQNNTNLLIRPTTYIPRNNISVEQTPVEQTVSQSSSISTPRRRVTTNTNSAPVTTTSVPRFALSMPDIIARNVATEDNSLVNYEELNKLRNVRTASTQTPNQTPNQTTTKNTDDGHYAGVFDSIQPTDWIGLGSNLFGSIGSWIAGRNNPTLNYSEPTRPVMEQPVRMITNYNNRPQISNVEQTIRRSMRDISSNTGSSRAALQRMQRIRNAGTQNINELETERENVETTLRNADASNRQRVRARNAAAYNDYLEQRNKIRNLGRTVDYENGIRRINNNIGLFSNINTSFQDFLNNINQRNQFNNTLGYLRGASPNVDDRIFRDMGVIFSRMFNTRK